MDICIEEGNNRNIVNVAQDQPIQSELIRTSSCQLVDENTSSISTITSTTQSSSVIDDRVPTTPSSQTTSQTSSTSTKPAIGSTIDDESL